MKKQVMTNEERKAVIAALLESIGQLAFSAIDSGQTAPSPFGLIHAATDFLQEQVDGIGAALKSAGIDVAALVAEKRRQAAEVETEPADETGNVVSMKGRKSIH